MTSSDINEAELDVKIFGNGNENLQNPKPAPESNSKPMASESFDLSTSGTSGTMRPMGHYQYKLPMEEEERLERLFRQLDVTKNGRVDVRDLTEGLRQMGIPLRESDAVVSYL